MFFQESPITGQGLLASFRLIEPGDYHNQVLFYERHQQHLVLLDDEDMLEVVCAYAEALFALGRYERHINMVHEAIERSFESNVTTWEDQDILCLMLFKKAASYYNLMRYAEAKTVLESLIRLEPNEPMYAAFLLRVRRRMVAPWIKHTRSLCILFFLVGAAFTALELLIIHPFYPDFALLAERLRWTMFGSGILFGLIPEIIRYLRSYWQNRAFVHAVKANFSNKMQ